ncbi:hypothetical protein ml_356 [Mollivirus sibericum]|uniref:hypothetical protein n=1 Tax=Mollivirus sibericum TaxID=1678078 RepID=UPI0006B2E90B|nr:hypothetical protein ml_356 [Mollivirus sibericum]ALD62158.1 hypothetical protein ml_356 [Mollivirus sibericum]
MMMAAASSRPPCRPDPNATRNQLIYNAAILQEAGQRIASQADAYLADRHPEGYQIGSIYPQGDQDDQTCDQLWGSWVAGAVRTNAGRASFSPENLTSNVIAAIAAPIFYDAGGQVETYFTAGRSCSADILGGDSVVPGSNPPRTSIGTLMQSIRDNNTIARTLVPLKRRVLSRWGTLSEADRARVYGMSDEMIDKLGRRVGMSEEDWAWALQGAVMACLLASIQGLPQSLIVSQELQRATERARQSADEALVETVRMITPANILAVLDWLSTSPVAGETEAVLPQPVAFVLNRVAGDGACYYRSIAVSLFYHATGISLLADRSLPAGVYDASATYQSSARAYANSNISAAIANGLTTWLRFWSFTVLASGVPLSAISFEDGIDMGSFVSESRCYSRVADLVADVIADPALVMRRLTDPDYPWCMSMGVALRYGLWLLMLLDPDFYRPTERSWNAVSPYLLPFITAPINKGPYQVNPEAALAKQFHVYSLLDNEWSQETRDNLGLEAALKEGLSSDTRRDLTLAWARELAKSGCNATNADDLAIQALFYNVPSSQATYMASPVAYRPRVPFAFGRPGAQGVTSRLSAGTATDPSLPGDVIVPAVPYPLPLRGQNLVSVQEHLCVMFEPGHYDSLTPYPSVARRLSDDDMLRYAYGLPVSDPDLPSPPQMPDAVRTNLMPRFDPDLHRRESWLPFMEAAVGP